MYPEEEVVMCEFQPANNQEPADRSLTSSIAGDYQTLADDDEQQRTVKDRDQEAITTGAGVILYGRARFQHERLAKRQSD
jgi:hypothetical protein